MADEIAEIKIALKNDTLVVGKETVLKQLKTGKVSKVLLSSNISEDMKSEIEVFAKFSKTPVIVLDVPSDELKVVCKKQFLVSVLAIRK
jgi:ribosomal protein L30E